MCCRFVVCVSFIVVYDVYNKIMIVIYNIDVPVITRRFLDVSGTSCFFIRVMYKNDCNLHHEHF